MVVWGDVKGGCLPRGAARAVLGAIDVLSAVVPAFILAFSFVEPAWAYVDPSVMTYAIQAIAGVAVGLSAVAGVALRRSRRKLLAMLQIDENARKVMEEPVHRLDDQGNPIQDEWEHRVGDAADDASAARDAGESASARAAFDLSFRQRLPYALLAAGFAVFTLCIVAPFELMAASAGSLVLSLGSIWPIMTIAAVILFAALGFALASIRGRAFTVAIVLVVAVGVCFYIQAMFMNGGLPSADGRPVAWGDFAPAAVVSLIVWAAVIAVTQVLAARFAAPVRFFAAAVSLVLIIVQGVGVASLFADPQNSTSSLTGAGGSSYMMTQEGLFSPEEQNNVVVFVLDTYDTRFLEEAVAEDPALVDGLAGFVWFKDSVGSMIPTRYGLPFLLNGQLPREGEPMSTFLHERYVRSTYLEDIDHAGYRIGYYTDLPGTEYADGEVASRVFGYGMNMHQLDSSAIDAPGTWAVLMQCALYRDLPWVFKPAFWFYTDEVNRRMVRNVGGADATESAESQLYLMDDAGFYRQLRTAGLTLRDDTGEAGQPVKGGFRFIHMLGPHYPYNIDRSGQDVGIGNSNRLDQAIGSLRMVEEYLAQMKALGVYDDATIIITADHGDWYLTPDPLEEPSSPVLLVKPACSSQQAAHPLTTSDAPVWAGDVLATVLQAVGADLHSVDGVALQEAASAALAGGEPTGLLANSRDRSYLATLSDGAHDTQIIEYSIEGDVRDMDSWRLTGVAWNAQE